MEIQCLSLRDFRLPPRSGREVLSSELLRSEWWSGFEDGTDRLPRIVGNCHYSLGNSPEERVLRSVTVRLTS